MGRRLLGLKVAEDRLGEETRNDIAEGRQGRAGHGREGIGERELTYSYEAKSECRRSFDLHFLEAHLTLRPSTYVKGIGGVHPGEQEPIGSRLTQQERGVQEVIRLGNSPPFADTGSSSR